MQKSLLLTFSLFSFISLFAQFELDNNNIKARNEQNGILFNNSSTFSGGFEAPINSGLNSFYAFNFWVGGMHDSTAYAYGGRFFQLSDVSIRFGPIMNPEYYETENEIWDRVWNITKLEIEDHILNYSEPGYMMPEVIENWPAHGDISKGQAFYLAPFVDLNNDGIYNPELGDYPRILGEQAIYSIYNGERSNELMAPMGIETHLMLYAISCDPQLADVIFCYVKQYNRSNIDYENAYMGFFSDFDIGNSSDDASYTDVMRSSIFGQNGDAYDENGYESDLPYQSVTILRGVLQDSDDIDNEYGIEENESVNGSGYGDGIVDNEYRNLDFSIRIENSNTPMGDPSTASEYYNNLSGKWKDGTLVTYGGTGYSTDSNNTPSRYVGSMNDYYLYGTYGEEPLYPFWDLPIPNDTRMIASSGPFTFNSNTSKDMYTAFVFSRYGSEVTSMNFVAFLLEIDYVKAAFNFYSDLQCSDIVLGINSNQIDNNRSLAIYPNPFIDHIQFNYDGNDMNAKVFIYDLLGHEQFQSSVQNGSNDLNLDELDGNAFIIKLVDQDGIYTQRVMRN